MCFVIQSEAKNLGSIKWVFSRSFLPSVVWMRYNEKRLHEFLFREGVFGKMSSGISGNDRNLHHNRFRNRHHSNRIRNLHRSTC